MNETAISVRGLRKRYGDHEALRGIDLEVAEGEVLGFLGANGAGKTTTIEILEGYRSRNDGEVRVLGVDPRSRPGPGGSGSVSCCSPASSTRCSPSRRR